MSDTKQMINKILFEIEEGNSDIHPSDKKTVNQVMEILLNRKLNGSDTEPQQGVGNTALDLQELKKWRDKNNQIYMINTEHAIYSNRPFWGRLLVFVKKAVRKLIRPIINPIVADQNEFNASVTAAINAIYNNGITTDVYIREQQDHSNKINEINEQLQNIQNIISTEDVYSLMDYQKFSDAFRGSVQEIKDKLRMYIPYFAGKSKVVDLGCGRGEFLELLKENNIEGKGVDLYGKFVQECREKNLDVEEKDAVAYVHDLDTESLDGIFSSQLIEHLETIDLVRLCRDSYDKLKWGGCIILETPNPMCLSIYTNAFYIDPTHSKPVHPKTLEYILKDAGFKSVEILFTENSKINYKLPLLNVENVANLHEFNDGLNCLSDLIWGSQNYAVVATK